MYSFFLDQTQLPVAPSKLSLKITNRNKTINLINEGEVNILKAAGLTEIGFSVLIPQVRYPFAVYPDGFQEASFYLALLERLKVEKRPFQFIVSRVSPAGKLLFDTNMTVSLEDYGIEEDANNGTDIVVPIKLKQFRPYGTKKVQVKQTPEKKTMSIQTERPTAKPTPKTHIVASGDTLWAICKKHLGDGNKFREIAKLNNISNPNLIFPGQVIRLD